MYISLDWINDIVNIESIKLNKLIDKLTLGGFEVEDTLELNVNKKKVIMLDISATANRADSLSMKGIANEISALVDKPIQKIKYSSTDLKFIENFRNNLISSEKNIDCSTLVGLTIENLTDLTVPNWITEKLICSGLEPVNNLLDFQTYILLETGYPLEFYDLEKIQKTLKTKNFNLTLKSANNNVLFKANNDVEYKLNSDVLVLEANNYPLSIAGIISNKDICYTNKTKSLLIEGSIFNSKKIRQQSRLLGIRTERSARYEKGLNNSSFYNSLLRLVQLLKISNPKLTCKVHTTFNVKQEQLPNITLNYLNIIEILGPVHNPVTNEPINLLPQQISQYLDRLNFVYQFDKSKQIWSVQIPIVRMDDIEREIDLIEEIGRLHGFNNFVTNLPNISKIGKEDLSYQIRKRLTSCFLNEGFNELIQYSLVNGQNPNNIKLVNPLVSDCSTLRTSLIPNLIKLVSDNLKQGNNSLEGFEFGHVFSGDINSSYLEKEVISGIFGGLTIKRNWNDTGKTLSWFEAKGKLEEIFKKLSITVFWKASTSHSYKGLLHPYRTAELYLSDKSKLGVFGQIHPIISKNNNISSELFLFEFDLECFKEKYKNQTLSLYTAYSSYPKITKDLSFIVNRDIAFNQIKKTIITHGTDFLTDITLLDEYRGNSIPKSQTSLCIQLTFQSTKKTLLTKEIDEIIKGLENILRKEYQVTLRV